MGKPTQSMSSTVTSSISQRLLAALPGPWKLDPRSLALFRIGLSVYLLTDVVGRFTNGWASLSFYTSTVEDDWLPPIFDPHDRFGGPNPPGGPDWHETLCYRGTATAQIGLFTVHVILTVLFGLGYFCHGTVPTLLWISTLSMVCRTPEEVTLNDVGDTLGHLHVLWCIFVPRLNAVWSVDATTCEVAKDGSITKDMVQNGDNPIYRHARPVHASVENPLPSQTTTTTTKEVTSSPAVVPCVVPVTGLPALAITIQITIIYIGLIVGRFSETAWWGPDYSVSETLTRRRSCRDDLSFPLEILTLLHVLQLVCLFGL